MVAQHRVFAIVAMILVADMFLLLAGFEFVTAFMTQFHLTADTWKSFSFFVGLALFVGLKTVLTVEVTVAVLAIHFWCDERGKIWAGLVCSLAGTTVLPHAVAIFRRFMVVAFLTMETVVITVQQCRDAGYFVEMVLDFQ